MSEEREEYGVVDTKLEDFEEVNQICRELEEEPMADVLVHTFLQQADPDSFQVREGDRGKEIVASPKQEGLSVSMRIFRSYDGVQLDICDMDGAMVHLVAGCRKTGTWAAGKGYEETFSIVARFRPDSKLILPSEEVQWLLEVMGGIARKTNVEYLSNQPRYWSDISPVKTGVMDETPALKGE